MCYEIDSEIVLANILRSHSNCSFTDLINLKRTIETSVGNVYVDVTKNSVYTSVENHPNMFSWSNKEIIRAKNSETYFEAEFINDYFNDDIEAKIKDKVLNILSKK
jgi:hypothetical protein